MWLNPVGVVQPRGLHRMASLASLAPMQRLWALTGLGTLAASTEYRFGHQCIRTSHLVTILVQTSPAICSGNISCSNCLSFCRPRVQVYRRAQPSSRTLRAASTRVPVPQPAPPTLLTALTQHPSQSASHGEHNHGHILLARKLHMLLPEHSAAENQQQKLSHAATAGRGKRILAENTEVDVLIAHIGWIFVRLSRPRHLRLSVICSQEDSLSLWSRVRLSSTEGSRSIHPLRTTPQHHSQHRPCRAKRFEHEGLGDRERWRLFE